jgi:hypothetical protein
MALIATIISLITWAFKYGPTIVTLIKQIVALIRSLSPAQQQQVVQNVMAAKAAADSSGDVTKLHEALTHICQNGMCRPRRPIFWTGE